MEDNKELKVIDLGLIIKRIWARKKLFLIVIPIVFLLSCAYILCIPRYYTSSLSLAPEMAGSGSGMGGTLGSLASSFGIDLGNMETTDAINPLLYPDLMDDNGFVMGLSKVRVKSMDGAIDCSYYEYIDKKQEMPWWGETVAKIKGWLAPKPEPRKGAGGESNPYFLTNKQDDVINSIKNNIAIAVDKKTGVISISVEAQDPLICKSVADSVKERLQIFITNYRTNKARIDAEYYKKLADNAKKDYEKSRRKYGSYADANTDVVLESLKAEQNDLENDMQLKYNTYTSLTTQYQAAAAKIQERTPAFTLIKGASVPVKPAGPKRMVFVLGMCFLAFVVTSLYVFFSAENKEK